MKLCSACLLGIKCSYKAEGKISDKVKELIKTEVLIPVCPEQLGGLATPRPRTEIKNNRVVDMDGNDYTDIYIKGANEVVNIAKIFNIKEAIMKQGSPSCGCGRLASGNFDGIKVEGDGITTKLLKESGIKVMSEEEL